MKLTLKGLLPLLIFLGLGIALAAGLTKDPRLLPSEMIDRPFPVFAISDLYDADDIITQEELKGQVTLINVFGSWCVSCDIEHPKLMELAQDKAVTLWGVDWRDEREKGKRWLKRRGNPYTRIIFDANSRLAIDLGVTGAPESYLIDKQGNIRYKYVGVITDKVWDDILQPLVMTFEAES